MCSERVELEQGNFITAMMRVSRPDALMRFPFQDDSGQMADILSGNGSKRAPDFCTMVEHARKRLAIAIFGQFSVSKHRMNVADIPDAIKELGFDMDSRMEKAFKEEGKHFEGAAISKNQWLQIVHKFVMKELFNRRKVSAMYRCHNSLNKCERSYSNPQKKSSYSSRGTGSNRRGVDVRFVNNYDSNEFPPQAYCSDWDEEDSIYVGDVSCSPGHSAELEPSDYFDEENSQYASDLRFDESVVAQLLRETSNTPSSDAYFPSKSARNSGRLVSTVLSKPNRYSGYSQRAPHQPSDDADAPYRTRNKIMLQTGGQKSTNSTQLRRKAAQSRIKESVRRDKHAYINSRANRFRSYHECPAPPRTGYESYFNGDGGLDIDIEYFPSEDDAEFVNPGCTYDETDEWFDSNFPLLRREVPGVGRNDQKADTNRYKFTDIGPVDPRYIEEYKALKREVAE